MRVKEIREKYPDPVPADQSCGDKYCVLGAALLFQNKPLEKYDKHFPLPTYAARQLGISLIRAMAIAAENDQGHIEEAWTLLDRALAVKEMAIS